MVRESTCIGFFEHALQPPLKAPILHLHRCEIATREIAPPVVKEVEVATTLKNKEMEPKGVPEESESDKVLPKEMEVRDEAVSSCSQVLQHDQPQIPETESDQTEQQVQATQDNGQHTQEEQEPV